MLHAQKDCQPSIWGTLLRLFLLLPPAPRGGGGGCYAEGSKVDDREVGGNQHNFRLTACEDNHSVIQSVLKRRSPAMRYISRTHRVNLDWVCEVFQHPEVSQRYVRTNAQVADVLTKRSVVCLVDYVPLG
jgi:hypothetical protein